MTTATTRTLAVVQQEQDSCYRTTKQCSCTICKALISSSTSTRTSSSSSTTCDSDFRTTMSPIPMCIRTTRFFRLSETNTKQLVPVLLLVLLISVSGVFSLPIPGTNETETESVNESYKNRTNRNNTLPEFSISSLESDSEVSEGQASSITNGSYTTENNNSVGLSHTKVSPYLQAQTAGILGLRVEEVSKGVSYQHKGVSVILSEKSASIRLFGDRFTQNTVIRFVTEGAERGTDCDDFSSTRIFQVHGDSDHSAVSDIELPSLNEKYGDEVYYICVRETDTDMPWVHQGTDQWLQIKTVEALLPLWLKIVFIVILLMLSGLFSGLNLGLMSLDRTEMKIIANTGSPKERKYAKLIQPLRNKGNFLLCSLLLGNVMVNSTLTILLDDISTGLIAVIGSTLSIVILGEIIPQAICSRHGLAVGAKTVYLTKLFMLLTFPISYPISVLLDKALGEEIGNVYNRDRLKELIRVTEGYSDLQKDEVNIISGALDLKQKTVKDVMTKLETVFMLPIDVILDYDTVSEIMAQGYSRIPVYDGSRQRVVSLLYTRDLALYDPADKMPMRLFCQFYNNKVMFVFDTTTLDVLFRDFKQGEQGHLAFVQAIVGTEDTDPNYEIVGLVTLEDVLEELIQAEINDETDVYTYKIERTRAKIEGRPSYPWSGDEKYQIEVSSQLHLAAYQFLSTSIDEFGAARISTNILQRMLNQNFFFQIKVKRDWTEKFTDPTTFIYQRGKLCDYFMLILEGRVQCEMGKERLVFESGPFSYYGTQALALNIIPDSAEPPPAPKKEEPSHAVVRRVSTGSNSIELYCPPTFIPDYTVRAVTDVTFMRISRSIYMAAVQATMLERTYLGDTCAQKEVAVHFEEQMDKMRKRNSNISFSTFSTITNNSDIDYNENGSSSRSDSQRSVRKASPSNDSIDQSPNGTPKVRKKSLSANLSDVILKPNLLLNGGPDHFANIKDKDMTTGDTSQYKASSIGDNKPNNNQVIMNGYLNPGTDFPMNNATSARNKRNSITRPKSNKKAESIKEEEPSNNASMTDKSNAAGSKDDVEQSKL